MDIRKFGITIAVAILTAILIYSIGDAIAPQVDYDNCYGTKIGPDPVRAERTQCSDALLDEVAQKTCMENEFSYEAVYDASGCVARYECITCYKEQQDANERHNMIIFYTALVLGLVAIVVGFLLPLGSIHEWVGLGFIIGGVISLFVGTVQYWGDLARQIRPLIILVELGIVLALVYLRIARNETTVPPVAPITRKKKR